MLFKVFELEFRKDFNLLIEVIFNYQFIYFEVYIVYVDMVLRNEVVYKLMLDIIEFLIEYYKDIYCVNVKVNIYDWFEKEIQCKKFYEDFIQVINKFVFWIYVLVFEGFEEDGVGELFSGKSEEVKNVVMNLVKFLFLLLFRIVDVVC